MGFEIALDDLGAGYSGLRLWSELLPDYVKIDKHFIQKLHEDPVKMNFVKSIQNIATALNCKVIAEGIETADEFRAIEKIGIAYAQGYHFGRPMVTPIKKLDSSLFAASYVGYYEPNLFNLRKAPYLAEYIKTGASETAISEA
jgi:EAL domain-containing protein (putative c-di-GMP-specific phosphodiesterase class I)